MSKVIYLRYTPSGFGITVTLGRYVNGVFVEKPNRTIREQMQDSLKENPDYKFTSLVDIKSKYASEECALLILDKPLKNS